MLSTNPETSRIVHPPIPRIPPLSSSSPLPHPTSPDAFPLAFAEAFNHGSLDAVASLYDEASVLNLGVGKVLRGPAAIRPALAQFLAPGLPIAVTTRFVVATGDTALVAFDWVIDGRGPDGTPVHMQGRAMDVLGRRPDGAWRQLLDQPFGSDTPLA